MHCLQQKWCKNRENKNIYKLPLKMNFDIQLHIKSLKLWAINKMNSVKCVFNQNDNSRVFWTLQTGFYNPFRKRFINSYKTICCSYDLFCRKYIWLYLILKMLLFSFIYSLLHYLITVQEQYFDVDIVDYISFCHFRCWIRTWIVFWDTCKFKWAFIIRTVK